ncbi:hypothetical protein H9P43_001597 [Blastocladiella emersonii ATCC 22665]|nr:hypothetical protein H9P43_001597 [Blastocladiella emersonii ATCC 22665]
MNTTAMFAGATRRALAAIARPAAASAFRPVARAAAASRHLHAAAVNLNAAAAPAATRGPKSIAVVDVPVKGKTVPLHAIWLRDHCKCAECWHPITKQRLVETNTIPRDIQPKSVVAEKGAVKITWPDGHVSTFEDSWLANHAYSDKSEFRHLERTFPPKLWGAEIAKAPPAVQYDEVMDKSNKGLGKWLENIAVYGFSFVHGVPATIEKTKELSERIAFIRETHYGTYWDFTPNLEHGDTAYTSIALPAHTDTTYFTDPIGLQLFHLLEFKGKGGESLLVDGFEVAKQLKTQSPDAYAALRDLRVAAHCAGDRDTYIYPSPRYQSMFTEDPATGALTQIRYNNNDRSTLNHLSHADVARYYDALLQWQELLVSKKNEYWFPLAPGTVVVFDNHRVLHGRAAFTGHRRLSGCYINGDDWRSRLRTVLGDDRSMC